MISDELLRQLDDPNEPKTEREHVAADKIADLRQRLSEQFANQYEMADWVERARQMEPEIERLRAENLDLRQRLEAAERLAESHASESKRLRERMESVEREKNEAMDADYRLIVKDRDRIRTLEAALWTLHEHAKLHMKIADNVEREVSNALAAPQPPAQDGVDNLMDELSAEIDSMSDEEIRAESAEDGITGKGVRRAIGFADEASGDEALDIDGALDCLYTKAMAGRDPVGPDGYAIAEAYGVVVSALRARQQSRVPDVLEREDWGLVPVNVPTGGDDYEVEWTVIEYYMSTPKEREIGRGRSPDEAIDRAMARHDYSRSGRDEQED